ncbi:MAG: efflux RND transporter permease subunit [Pseudomonadales bacterium]|nr:efflux RND transporter permease subunit [Pseudomonadales bacterium]
MEKTITWFVDNPIAANLMMWIFLVGGAVSLFTMHKEEFPSIEPGIIQVQVPYLGAAPEEVEQAVCIRIEEAVEGITGLDRIRSIAAEGLCTVMLEITTDADDSKVLNEVKSKIDGISTFPIETERPSISTLAFVGQTIVVALSGKADEATLKRIADDIRNDISALEGISRVAVNYTRPYEISVEISENTLRQYNLTLASIAQSIRHSSLDMPGGSIRTAGGEILVRTKGQAYRGREFEDIVVVTRSDGTHITLGEIAIVRDDFEEGYLSAKFDGDPAAMITVYRIGDEDTINSAAAVKRYVNQIRPTIPEGLKLTIWTDQSVSLGRRIDALTKSAYAGLSLVLLILALFLRFKVAIWVAAGIPIAVAGALWVFPQAGINISTMTILAFILVLGIVVDDAIVIGERVFSHESTASNHRQAAIMGTLEVSTPVIFGVLTTIAAFLPILLMESKMGAFFSIIGWVVVVCLAFSIIESQLILPAHLAHRKTQNYFMSESTFVQRWIMFQSIFSGALTNLAQNFYQPFLVKTLQWRWVTWAIGTAVLVTAVALIASGRVIFQFFPSVDGDRIYATLNMPQGINVEVTEAGVKQIENAAFALGEQLDAEFGLSGGEHVITHIFSSIGSDAARSNGPPQLKSGGSHLAEVVIELIPIAERRGITATKISERWREMTQTIPDAIELKFDASSFSAGEPLLIEIQGRDVEQLRIAAASLREDLSRYPGILDLTDSFRAGKQEVKLNILEHAKPLGITLNDLARQVRQAFYGEEAQRLQRGSDDVKVMVRYPENERRSLGNLEDMRIRTKDGLEVPFTAVAEVQYGHGYSSIQRQNQKRTVSVTGDINRNLVTPEEIMSSIQLVLCENKSTFSNRKNRCHNSEFPGVSYSLGGEQEVRTEAIGSMVNTIPIALLVIYALLAIPLKSYTQPLVIMSVIPFGAVGAIVGHYIMDKDLIFFSLLGIIALSGVVVNASLVMVDHINRQRALGISVFDAVTMAGVARFRPIILTSVTTFVGLIPLMTSTDRELSMFIPMAISLAFGVLFATVITLFLVPSLYLMLQDWLVLLGVDKSVDAALIEQNQDPSTQLDN